MAEINGISVPFIPIVKETGQTVSRPIRDVSNSFDNLFQEELNKVKFSAHAQKRLESRNIFLNSNELSKIQTAVEKAESKGSKDSLVMMDNTAFVVNVPNRTVVTALQVGQDNDNVFTNIDSVVFT
ncbi:MAG: flagellar protein [Bacteroidetes bacterium]|nr:flagellar protein [Bacteroidota bacterium]